MPNNNYNHLLPLLYLLTYYKLITIRLRTTNLTIYMYKKKHFASNLLIQMGLYTTRVMEL